MRLTKAKRQQIVSRALAPFDDHLVKMNKVMKEIVTRIIEAEIGPENRALMSQLPEDYFPVVHYVRVKIGGGSMKRLPCNAVPVPINIGMYGNEIILPEDSEFVVEVERQTALEVAYKAKRQIAEVKVKQIVNAVNTKKQLLELWPEADKYFGSVERTHHPITVRAAEVNAALAQA